jgi:tRNA 2-thiouridine synthesizing protein E
MKEKTIAGTTINFTDEGYFTEPQKWSKEIAIAYAKEDGIELTDKHLEVLEFIREKFFAGETLTIRSIGKSGIVDIKGFYKLFPGAPLKKASKYAGISKPTSCV